MATVRASPADTRDAVLTVAARLFDARGFDAVSISDLTATSGVSNGSIYHHFASKDGVLAELVVGALSAYHRTLTAAVEAHAGDAEGCIRAAVAHDLAWFERHPRAARLVIAHRDAVAAGDAGRNALRAADRQAVRRLRDWLERHADAAGIPPDVDPDLLHALVLGPAHELGSLWLAKRIHRRPTSFSPALGDAAWAAVRSLSPERHRPPR